jgi:hypothetical protein
VPLSQVRCAMNVWVTSSYDERDVGGVIDSPEKESLGLILPGRAG